MHEQHYEIYEPTPALPDAEGKALLRELCTLEADIDLDEKGRLRRGGRKSIAAKAAMATLNRALAAAAARFGNHQEFASWLIRNNCEHVEYFFDQHKPERRVS
jgi:hypothetical protein